jgi:hypothetical protein
MRISRGTKNESINALGRFALLACFVGVLAVTAWRGTRPPGCSSFIRGSRGLAGGLPWRRRSPRPWYDRIWRRRLRSRPARVPTKTSAARVDALVQAGDIGRARDAAEEFLRRYPNSSYCQHIETLTGVHPRPALPGE